MNTNTNDCDHDERRDVDRTPQNQCGGPRGHDDPNDEESGLQTVKGGTILWTVAFIIGLSLLTEHPRIRAAERAGGR